LPDPRVVDLPLARPQGVIVSSNPVEAIPESSLVTSWYHWWDCPRAGIVVIAGCAHYFVSTFSEALDDYEPAFRLWPVPQEVLDAEGRRWADWVVWRTSFDRGENPPPYTLPVEFKPLESNWVPPEDAISAVPIWELDPDRSFRFREPQHRVRWIASGT